MKKRTYNLLINKIAFQNLKINSTLINSKGELEFLDYSAIKKFSHKINEDENYPKQPARAGDMYAISIISAATRNVIKTFEHYNKIDLFSEAYQGLEDQFESQNLQKLFNALIKNYFPIESRITSRAYPNKEIVEKLFEIWLNNSNPAFKRYEFLFSEKDAFINTIYSDVISYLHNFFNELPNFADSSRSLLDFITLPSKMNPDSIRSQLIYIKENWGKYLDDNAFLLRGIDYLEEQNKAGAPGPGPANVYTFDSADDVADDRERFTADKNWMPKVVLLTKSTYVWLDQLSKRYKRNISRLDEIPEDVFIELSQSGFTALWLIGIWERSEISKKIKQRTGNYDAMGSAYSIKRYDIANNLGGWKAYEKLRDKALRHNIILAADMVPNHTGMDAEWMLQHPEWYLQTENPPFPAYNFKSENLLPENKFEIKIEDGYYDHSDAAVVFRWRNIETGKTRYIYHGNDGTHLPWNDTAQLNYLKKEVRETIIEKILEIAKKFHIIRFDAAMTLAKKHFQRLWFPLPGKGGAIPSRAEYSLSRSEFNKLFPSEFWREVVERIEQEVPNTLLLAEAFWMMEGYFVRNLGMHRVYNSAFMNMLKNEENTKYKKTLLNVLEHNPQILKRFVNFMSNPDEETALSQFGKDDKYFGVCILMCTMPGLPMFAHGQIEGFREKYGMEYKQPKYDERTDYSLVKRHQREIFPLLKRRELFAEVDFFYLMNFFTFQGEVNDNVFAYLNGNQNEKALVIFNNKYEETEGFIRNGSYPHRENGKTIWQEFSLADLLNLPNSENSFLIMKNQPNGFEYIFKCDILISEGLEIRLSAFKYFVFMDMKIVEETPDSNYSAVFKHFKGQGVKSIEVEQKRIKLLPLLDKFTQLIKPIAMRYLFEHLTHPQSKAAEQKLGEYGFRVEEFLSHLTDHLKTGSNISRTKNQIISRIKKFFKIWNHSNLNADFEMNKENIIAVFYWIILNSTCALIDSQTKINVLLNDLLLSSEIEQNIQAIFPGIVPNEFLNKLEILCKFAHLYQSMDQKTNTNLFAQLLNDKKVRKYILVNVYNETEWYNAERFEDLISSLFWVNLIQSDLGEDTLKTDNKIKIFFRKIFDAHKRSSYRIKKLITQLSDSEVFDEK